MQHRAEIRFRTRLTVRISAIDPGHNPRTFFYHFCEHTELTTGAGGFGLKAGFRQSGFQLGTFNEAVSGAFDFGRDCTQELGFFSTRHPTVDSESVVRQAGSHIYFSCLRGEKGWWQTLSRAWIRRVE